MKKFFYPRLAFDGIRKNKRLYLPYILTQIGMIMMYFSVIFLRYGESLKGTFGEGTVSIVLMLGGWVIAIFACIFLFYTNSFLIRRRKKEFGLYNILGMDKKNIHYSSGTKSLQYSISPFYFTFLEFIFHSFLLLQFLFLSVPAFCPTAP